MSDEAAPSTEPSTPAVQRARRISNPRPKKAAKVAKSKAAPKELPVAPVIEPEPAAIEISAPEPVAVSSIEGEWPEPEPASTGTAGTTENTKRKRRRRKGKGGAATAEREESGAPHPQQSEISGPSPRPQQPAAPVPQPQRPKADFGLLPKMAWKIFLAEVSEEGVALISDHDAKELSRRCFRLAEIFIEEQSRRR